MQRAVSTESRGRDQAEVMTDGSGSKLADVFQQVVISSFGQLSLPQLYYQLHNDFFFLHKGWGAAKSACRNLLHLVKTHKTHALCISCSGFDGLLVQMCSDTSPKRDPCL